MVMINIVKIESITATEDCLINAFSVRNLFLLTQLFIYLCHTHLIKIKGFRYNMSKHIV